MEWGSVGVFSAHCQSVVPYSRRARLGPRWSSLDSAISPSIKAKVFKPVTGGTTANVGDSVMVGPGGSATVVYEDGCKINVKPGAVTTIAPLSPCASGSNAQNYNNCPIGSDGRPHCEDDTWGWIIGGTLFGIGIGIAAYEASKSNGTTTPASP